jgi:hypothetical protein
MTRIAITLIFTLLLCAPRPSHAGVSDKVKSLTSWFTHWKQALERSAVESRYRRGMRTTAVAAVRGAGQGGEDPELPYWKGTWSDKKMAQRLKEREELAQAVELILGGKAAEGAAALAAFEKKHPKSSLLADVHEAQAKLAEMNPPAEPTEKKTEAEPAETAAAAAEPKASE